MFAVRPDRTARNELSDHGTPPVLGLILPDPEH